MKKRMFFLFLALLIFTECAVVFAKSPRIYKENVGWERTVISYNTPEDCIKSLIPFLLITIIGIILVEIFGDIPVLNVIICIPAGICCLIFGCILVLHIMALVFYFLG